MIKSMAEKMKFFAGTPGDIFVMKYVSPTTHEVAYIEHINGIADGGIEGVCGLALHENWLEADWFNTKEEVDSRIAESVKHLYSAERISVNAGGDTMKSHLAQLKDLASSCTDLEELREGSNLMDGVVNTFVARIRELQESPADKAERERGEKAAQLLAERGVGYIMNSYAPFNQETAEDMYITDVSIRDNRLIIRGVSHDLERDSGLNAEPNIMMAEVDMWISDIRVPTVSLDGIFTIQLLKSTRRDYMLVPPGEAYHERAIKSMQKIIEGFRKAIPEKLEENEPWLAS